MKSLKRAASLCAVLALLLSCASIPAAFAAEEGDGGDGYSAISEYDLYAEAVAIGFLNSDFTINRAYRPPEGMTEPASEPTATVTEPVEPPTESPTTPEEPPTDQPTMPEEPTREAPTGPEEDTDPPQTEEPTLGPENGNALPAGLAAYARAQGMTERQFYERMGKYAADATAESIGPLASHACDQSEGEPNACYSRVFDYFDSTGKKLWSVILIAKYYLTPNSVRCEMYQTAFDTEDARWVCEKKDVTVRGCETRVDFTVKKYLAFVPTATVERSLSLFVTPEGIYRYDPDLLHKGDVNFNAKIDAADARRTLRISARLDRPDAREFITADYDSDGAVTSRDARMILRRAARIS
ncbi:MAG: hypothetical protein IJL26_08185 [Clostridia bacterium]|nr:hypothetical protein [Clostridia bacterium]